MSRVFVAGVGAVSPAGWNVTSLRDALAKGEPLPVQPLARPGIEKPFNIRLVPTPAVRPAFLAHPRLRRASAITHYAASAALEALSGLRERDGGKQLRLGLVACFQSGCVQYTCRFYDEAIKNPATASPLIFPETVYAAPASHVAALLENVTLACSLVGDPSSFLQGVALGAQWLAENRVDACVVLGAEETNWIIADVLRRFDRPAILSAGAGALCLVRDQSLSLGVELSAITNVHTMTARKNRREAAAAMRQELGVDNLEALLVDGTGNSARSDATELGAWSDWPGARLSPKHILGEGMMAASAWQCVMACDALAGARFSAAQVSLVGANHQAVGACFSPTAISGLSGGKAIGTIGS